MKKLLILLILPIVLIGCTSKSDYLAPLKKSFSAEVEGKVNDVDFSAHIKVSEIKTSEDGENSYRDIEITFISPESVKGLSVVRKNGIFSHIDGVEQREDPSAEGFLEIAEALLCEGQITSVGVEEISEKSYTLIKIEDGQNICSYYVGSESGNPEYVDAKINGRSVFLKIIWLESDNAEI
jgi:hypothetical protein